MLHPGTIKINVKGAFIVDDDPPTPCSTGRTTPTSDEKKANGVNGINGDGEYFEYQHDTQAIRLPNHTAVVSHIAIDVSVVECASKEFNAKYHAHTC
jgi:type II pantothenate kinase